MNEQKPLSRKLLRSFVAGELDQTETEQIMAQLAEDEASLQIVDELWHDQPSQTAVIQLPNLEPERAQQVRRRIIRQIHRSDLAINVMKLGTQGFSNVAMSLLRPLLDSKNRERRHRRGDRKND
jgi:hypothetical protein